MAAPRAVAGAERPPPQGRIVMVRRPPRNGTLFGSNLPGKQILVDLRISMSSPSLPLKVGHFRASPAARRLMSGGDLLALSDQGAS